MGSKRILREGPTAQHGSANPGFRCPFYIKWRGLETWRRLVDCAVECDCLGCHFKVGRRAVSVVCTLGCSLL